MNHGMDDPDYCAVMINSFKHPDMPAVKTGDDCCGLMMNYFERGKKIRPNHFESLEAFIEQGLYVYDPEMLMLLGYMR